MIDNQALANNCRTDTFPLSNNKKYHLEALTDGGVTLLETASRTFCGRVFLLENNKWQVEYAYTTDCPTEFHSRDAAIYTLAASIAEHNAFYTATLAAYGEVG